MWKGISQQNRSCTEKWIGTKSGIVSVWSKPKHILQVNRAIEAGRPVLRINIVLSFFSVKWQCCQYRNSISVFVCLFLVSGCRSLQARLYVARQSYRINIKTAWVIVLMQKKEVFLKEIIKKNIQCSNKRI